MVARCRLALCAARAFARAPEAEAREELDHRGRPQLLHQLGPFYAPQFELDRSGGRMPPTRAHNEMHNPSGARCLTQAQRHTQALLITHATKRPTPQFLDDIWVKGKPPFGPQPWLWPEQVRMVAHVWYSRRALASREHMPPAAPISSACRHVTRR